MQKEPVRQKERERAFLVTGTACAKAPRQEGAWGMPRIGCQHAQKEPGNLRGPGHMGPCGLSQSPVAYPKVVGAVGPVETGVSCQGFVL